MAKSKTPQGGTAQSNTKKSKTGKTQMRGRPSVYREEYADMAETAAAEFGAIDAQLAKLFKVEPRTIAVWKKKKGFADALKRGKAIANEKVTRSLFQRATGYDYTEQRQAKRSDGMQEMVLFKRHAPPDVTACLKWLFNREPKEWREHRDTLENAGEPITPVTINVIAQSARTVTATDVAQEAKT